MSTAAASKKTTLRAEGFSCPSCVSKIEKGLKRVDGVTDATVHFASSRIEVQHEPSRATTDGLVAAVKKAGYTAKPSAF